MEKFKEIPKQPSKEKLIELTEKVHDEDVPNWTTSEMIEAFKALKTVSFYWYRDERFL